MARRRRRTRLPSQTHASQECNGVTRRCSPRRHPQNHTSADGAVLTCRRSPRLHPQTQDSAAGAAVNRRRSPRLHPQTQDSAAETGVTRRRRRSGTSLAAAASLPDDDDILWEILLRLPPQPSSLPRSSAVCKGWRGLVTDPKFHRQFYTYHRKAPLLGVFSQRNWGSAIVFSPILDPPDRIPPGRFDLGCSSDDYDLLDCRHGLVLVKNSSRRVVIVHDPVTSEQRRLAVPPEFHTHLFNGAVLCTASDQGHVHGGCHSSTFKVVLISSVCKRPDHVQTFISVYTSETGIWGNLILAEASCEVCGKPPVLLSNCLYWLSMDEDILEFDLGEHSLTVINGPPDTNHVSLMNYQVIQAEDGAFGYAILLYPQLQMWQRDVNSHGVGTWVAWKTIEMHSFLKLPPQVEESRTYLRGYDEDSDAIFLNVGRNIYTVHLKSMQSKKQYETNIVHRCWPLRSFYAPAISKCDEAGMLFHNP